MKQKGSELLNKDDNNKIFDLVGQSCEILSMTVIELHRSPDATGEGDWTKEEIGVICLVRDLNRKAYFFRIFCMIRKRMVWEYEINNKIQYSTPKPFLHSFKTKNYMYAFYFVSEQEASLLAARMNEISTDMLENERSSEGFKIHEINPSVEAPRRFTSLFNFNKNKNVRWSTISTGRSSSQNIWSMCLGNNEDMKKKNVTGDDIANPKHFEHISHIGEFREKWKQIQCSGNKINESLLKIPFSPSMLKISPSLSDSILPIVSDTSNRTSPDSTAASTPRIAERRPSVGRFCTFVHPGEDAMRNDDSDIALPFPRKQLPLPPCLSVYTSPSENVGHCGTNGISMVIPVCADDSFSHEESFPPPLPPKLSPRLSHRSVSPDHRNLDKIETSSLFHNPKELKELNFKYRQSFMNTSPIDVRIIPTSPKIATTKEVHYSNSSHVVISGRTSTECKSSAVSPRPPHPLPKIVAEKRKTVVNDEAEHLRHYDMVGQPRPVNSSVFKSISYATTEAASPSPSWSSGKKSFTFSDLSTNTVSQKKSDEAQLQNVTRKRYEVTPVMTRHPFLLPPTFTNPSSSTNITSSSVSSEPDAFRNCDTTKLPNSNPSQNGAIRNFGVVNSSNSASPQNIAVRNRITSNAPNLTSSRHDAVRVALNEAIRKGVSLKHVENRRKSFLRENSCQQL